MRTLGKGISGVTTRGATRLGGMAMSGLGAGLGIGAAFLGLQGLGSIFDKMRAVSPELNAELTKLKVAIGDALFPVAVQFADVLRENMPAIQSGLEMFGNALADAVQFWTEEAFNPEVWKDIGVAIAEAVQDAITGVGFGSETVAAPVRQQMIAAGQGDPVETQARLAFMQGNYLEGIVRSIEALFTGSEGANSL